MPAQKISRSEIQSSIFRLPGLGSKPRDFYDVD